MELPNFEAMTLDELIDWKAGQKERIRAEQEIYNACQEIYNRKVREMHVADSVKQVRLAAERNGVEPAAQAEDWRENGDNGQRIHAERYFTEAAMGNLQ